MADNAHVQSSGQAVRGPWGLELTFGVLFVILGAALISAPILTTISAVWLFGMVLFVGGILQIGYALFDWKSQGALGFLGGVVTLLFGILLLNKVLLGAVAITSLIGMYFFIQGVLCMVTAFDGKHKQTMGITLVVGLLSFFFAFIILGNILIVSTGLIGLLLGWNFIISGFGMIAAATFADNNAEQGQKTLGIIIFVFALFFFLVQVFSVNENTAEDMVVPTKAVPAMEAK
jgi:uncharacterized membrane protein HdeD (DUF308 family)